MSDGWAGWTGGEPGRTADEVLFAPPTFSERQVARAERDVRREALERSADLADDAAATAFRARMMGREPPTVEEFLASRSQVIDRESVSRSSASRMRLARDILERHGLDDVLPQRVTTVFDPNVGTLELDEDYEGRSRVRRAAAERDQRVLRRQLDELAGNRAWMSRYLQGDSRGEVTR